MKRTLPLALLICLAAAASAAPKIHYLNRGVKYHIGDAYYTKSADFDTLQAYGVVGQGLVLPFRVSFDDEVQVTLEKIWGIDAKPELLCKVYVDGTEMGTLGPENNGKSWTSPGSVKLEAGKVHQLRVVSEEVLDPDNFMVEGIVVATAKGADVIAVAPPKIVQYPKDDYFKSDFDPMLNKAAGPCEGLKERREWPAQKSPGVMLLTADAGSFKESPELAQLKPGETFAFQFRVGLLSPEGDRIRQPVEILTGRGARSGWVLSLEPLSGRALHGNMLKSGRYSASQFPAASYKPGAWNRVRLSYCADGTLSAELNGSRLEQSLDGRRGLQPVSLRVMGMEAGLAP
jgi:hypothetical protein